MDSDILLKYEQSTKETESKVASCKCLPKSVTLADEQLPKKTFAWNAVNKQRQSVASDNLNMITALFFTRLHIEYALY